ncbi:RNase H domain protein [Triangularia verruculosa]|uniref:RNase H domain protein n=1 Tax=Triangularia verruculosa TaxID=2587418 RepID=A0AAN6X6T9_9PEZI|nr:RNase H domain protein [Triangularia verruculosa]
MPLGWYLAQGLMPLGPISSDDEEGPCELPDGRLLWPVGPLPCDSGSHGLVWCGKCCVDYSFMDDSEYEDQNDDSFGSEPQVIHSNVVASPLDALGPRLTRGTGRAFPTKFVPPSASATPSELFSGRVKRMRVTRYTLPTDAGKAGWAFWYGSGPSGNQLIASSRLEKKGPFGADGIQTSNLAELRAVIAALRFRHWPGEGFHTMVIATDSEYVRGGEAVKNRDLWEALLGEIERYKDKGMAVEFWRIPSEWNTVADAAAKEAAAKEDAADVWTEMMGVNI